MPRAVKDPGRAKIDRFAVLDVLKLAGDDGATAKTLAQSARYIVNDGELHPPLNERDVEIVHDYLRTFKAEGLTEPCGLTRSDKGSGKPPTLWRLVRHG